jgi:hypothetical protein
MIGRLPEPGHRGSDPQLKRPILARPLHEPAFFEFSWSTFREPLPAAMNVSCASTTSRTREVLLPARDDRRHFVAAQIDAPQRIRELPVCESACV